MNEIDTNKDGRSREELDAYYRERDRYFAERDRYYAERDRYYRGTGPEGVEGAESAESVEGAGVMEWLDEDYPDEPAGPQLDEERIRREVRQSRARRSRAAQEKPRREEAKRTERPERAEAPRREEPKRAERPAKSETPRKEKRTTAAPENDAPKKKKKHPILLLLFLLLLGFAAFVGVKFVKRQSGYYTVAVFGVDSRNGNVGKGALSDVNIIARVDMESGEIKLVSIYRDTYTQISKDGDYHKFNEAYFRGGAEQAVWALEHNTDVKVDDYATFNWKAVVDTINILGGVDLEISDAEFAYINGFITETVNSTGVGSYQLEHAGMNHLDGVQAVAYARLRLMDNDYNRTERQRKVIALAFEKAKQANFATLNNILVTVMPQISTSVGVSDVMPFVKDIHKYYLGETAGFPFEKSTKNVGKMNCVIPVTWETNDIALHQFLYPETPYTPSTLAKQISDHVANKTGLGATGETAVKVDDLNTDGGSKPSANAAPAPEETKAEETKPAESETIEEITDHTDNTESTGDAESVESTENTDPAERAEGTDPGESAEHAAEAESTEAADPAEQEGNDEPIETAVTPEGGSSDGPQTGPAAANSEGPGSLPDSAGSGTSGPGSASE